MTVTIEVYEADNATPAATDPAHEIVAGQFTSCRYAEINSQSGGWGITVPNLVDGEQNPALSLLTIGRVVRFLVDDVVVGAGLVEDFDITSVSPEEEAGEVTEVSGRGLLAVLDKVRVRPDAGVGTLPWNPVRQLDYSALRLRDDDAAAPQGIWPPGVNTPPDYDATTPVHGRPIGMVNTDPEWILDQDVSAGGIAAGDYYIRQPDTFPGGR